MTGPAEGKVPIKATIQLQTNEIQTTLSSGEVYIHLKGYALARVTHLDIEHNALNKLIPPKRGKFLTIQGTKNGIQINLQGDQHINVASPKLKNILKIGEKTRAWVGGKFGGIYIGFQKKYTGSLEKIAQREKMV